MKFFAAALLAVAQAVKGEWEPQDYEHSHIKYKDVTTIEQVPVENQREV